MNLANIQKLLRQNKTFLAKQYAVKAIGIFGSYARGTAQEGSSDVDLLVEFSRPIGWEFVDLHAYLESLLSEKVDLVTTKALKPELESTILSEVIYL
jgi:predicted nucleotidyltransferase